MTAIVCEHCPDGHPDPESRRWGAFLASERDQDGQPTHLSVSPTNGAHVADSDAEWAFRKLNAPGIADAGHPVPRMPMGTTCAVHTHREWVPIEQHHVWPKGMGGPDTAANKIAVCANGHYSIHEVIRRLILNDGALPDATHFSAKVKKYAMQGWTEAGKPTHSGGGE